MHEGKAPPSLMARMTRVPPATRSVPGSARAATAADGVAARRTAKAMVFPSLRCLFAGALTIIDNRPSSRLLVNPLSPTGGGFTYFRSPSPMLVTASLSDQIRSAIIRRIVDGTYAPGDRLVELKLAAEFGVSQAPVREAFRRLEALSFLSTSARRGTYVTDTLGSGLVDLFIARGGLEEAATRLATPVRAGQVADLRGHIAQMREA